MYFTDSLSCTQVHIIKISVRLLTALSGRSAARVTPMDRVLYNYQGPCCEENTSLGLVLTVTQYSLYQFSQRRNRDSFHFPG